MSSNPFDRPVEAGSAALTAGSCAAAGGVVRAASVSASAMEGGRAACGMGESDGGMLARLLRIDARQISLPARGVRPATPAAGRRLARIVETFVFGYHAALAEGQADALAGRLDGVEAELRGFAYEGAAMALYVLDALTPWSRRRWNAFLRGPGERHAYMVYVGAGWAMARLPMPLGRARGVRRAIGRMDRLLGWLAIDGWAFHEAFFHAQQVVVRGERPKRLAGYARRAWDMGIGRGMWFAEGADVRRIAGRIAAMETSRHADLWSGAGLACAYAGGVEAADISALRGLAGGHRHHLGQGAAFAAKARQRADNPAEHTEAACGILCGMAARQAAALTDECLAAVDAQGTMACEASDGEPFEAWRSAIVSKLREVLP